MIISHDYNPERQLYYLGAKLLEVMPANRGVALFDAFQMLSEREDVSFSLFILTADWLFLIGAIDLDGGELVRCS